jgi:N-acetylglucosamine-6-phosphate deacetylase
MTFRRQLITMIAFTAKTIFTPLERIEEPLLLVEDGFIAEVTSRTRRELPEQCQEFNFADAILAPAFIDIHIHGGAGHDVMENDPATLIAVEHLLAAHGVGSYFPTTVTAPVDVTLSALERLSDAIEQPRDRSGSRACPVGIHLEGPFISHARRGVHPPENLLPPSLEIFDRFWEAARGHVRIMTIAPELPGAQELIAEAVKRGVCVSLGHSDADMNSTRAAVAAGARHATHTFNAMRPLDHREPGILGEVLTDSRLSADIIADGIHLDPAVVDMFLKVKGVDSSVLITDATAGTGMPEGRYRLGALDVEVKDGKCLSNGNLAGSVLTMDRALGNVMQFARWNLQQTLRLTTLNPARVAGLETRGILKSGAQADILVLSPEGEVRTIVIGGAGKF